MKLHLSLFIIVLFYCSAFVNAHPAKPFVHLSKKINTTNDSTEMVATIIGFLNWYKVNYERVNLAKITSFDAKGNYQVSMKACKKYIEFLKSSNCISKTFEKRWLNDFETKRKHLETHPQNEGPPEGFDYDLLLLNQEPELILKNIDKLKFTIAKITTHTSLIQMFGEWRYEIEMSFEKGKWKIDYIPSINDL